MTSALLPQPRESSRSANGHNQTFTDAEEVLAGGAAAARLQARVDRLHLLPSLRSQGRGGAYASIARMIGQPNAIATTAATGTAPAVSHSTVTDFARFRG